MFKTTGLVLRIQKIRDHNFRIILLTREYGKVTCWHKTKNCGYDMGDIINISLLRTNGTNTIQTIDNVLSLSWKTWNYDWIIWFLELLWLMTKGLPESMPYPWIFDDFEALVKNLRVTEGIREIHFILLKLRFLKHIWILDERNSDCSPIIDYIYSNIRTAPIQKLMLAKTPDRAIQEHLENTIKFSLSTLN